MIIIKILLLLSVIGLLAGCASTPCGLPGHPNHTDKICHYKLEIIEKDEVKQLVSGSVPESVLADNAKSSGSGHKKQDYSDYPPHVYRVFVGKDVKDVQVGKEVKFYKPPHDMSYGLRLGEGN